MSGGKRRGEIRIRKAGPVEKQSGGTHNRKARRAAKANGVQSEMFAPVDPETEKLRALWAAFGRHHERTRPEREARVNAMTSLDWQELALTKSDVSWDPLFSGLLLLAIPLWCRRHFRTDPDARVGRAHELAEVLAFSQGAAEIGEQATNHDSCPSHTVRAHGEISRSFNTIAEGLAIGAYCPGGATFAGCLWVVDGATLRLTRRSHCETFPLAEDSFWSEAAE